MNAERLLDAFNSLGDEPGTIQQFRKLVVGLAMSGKLVADEAMMAPAALLKEIEFRRRTLVQQGILRKQDAVVTLSHKNLPQGFHNPAHFVRLGGIARIEKGLTGIMKAKPGPYSLVVTAEDRTSCDHFDFEGSAAIVPLVSSAGHGKASLQRLHYQEGKFALGSILAAIFPHAPDLISARFLFEYLTAFKDELLVSQMIGTANVSLSIGKISEVPVPLVSPPVQRKVDKLMALCDRLEVVRGGREAARDRMAVASLARLNKPDTETFQTDARFALNALLALTARPDQIKQLRQTILNLAVRGKLVPQNPKDEQVPGLLKRIAAEKSRRVKEGTLREQKSLPPISNDEVNFELAQGWQWVRIGELIKLWNGFAFKSGDFQSAGFPVIRIGDLQDGEVTLCGAARVSEKVARTVGSEVWIPPGALLIAMSGATAGKTAFNRTGTPLLLNQRVGRIEVFLINVNFLRFFFETIVVRNLSISFGTAIPNLSAQQINETPIPLPPLAEQNRIVAKVDELMALCNELETGLTAAAAARSRLLDALLADALVPAEDCDLDAAE